MDPPFPGSVSFRREFTALKALARSDVLVTADNAYTLYQRRAIWRRAHFTFAQRYCVPLPLTSHSNIIFAVANINAGPGTAGNGAGVLAAFQMTYTDTIVTDNQW